MSSLSSSNTLALKWASDVGRVYRVQYNYDLTGTNWQYTSNEISATKTNTAIVISATGTSKQFYRIVQVR